MDIEKFRDYYSEKGNTFFKDIFITKYEEKLPKSASHVIGSISFEKVDEEDVHLYDDIINQSMSSYFEGYETFNFIIKLSKTKNKFKVELPDFYFKGNRAKDGSSELYSTIIKHCDNFFPSDDLFVIVPGVVLDELYLEFDDKFVASTNTYNGLVNFVGSVGNIRFYQNQMPDVPVVYIGKRNSSDYRYNIKEIDGEVMFSSYYKHSTKNVIRIDFIVKENKNDDNRC